MFGALSLRGSLQGAEQSNTLSTIRGVNPYERFLGHPMVSIERMRIKDSACTTHDVAHVRYQDQQDAVWAFQKMVEATK
ncbi:hypothetical protein FBZ90_107321 [Nitrospirillum pindoramense]|uniref:Uncharacterized protein n=1 Tax=Nitrospirillum amazonense TaxID=28077 RepID=A0A560H6H0_9PROT|nr:hypothetical protein FBZ90_107321 [Nitrospirillum amazonense]